MIVEQRTYTLHAGRQGEFLAAYDQHGRVPQTRILGNMVGWYTTEIGTLNQIVHMWGYDSFEERLRRRGELMQDPDFKVYLGLVRPMMQTQETKILIPAPWSPVR